MKLLCALLVVLAGAMVVLSFVPISPIFPFVDLDSSWKSALQYSTLKRFAWGRDVVFTFGPLGFLHTGMFWPTTYPLVLVYWSFMAVVVIVSVTSLGAALGWPAIYIASLTILYTFIVSVTPDVMVLGAVVLITARLFVAEVPSGLMYPVLASIALATMSLTKFTFLILAPALLALYSIAQILAHRARSAAVVCVTYAIFLLALWLLCGQDLTGLLPFVQTSLELAAGYGSAMLLEGPGAEPILYIATSVALAGAFALSHRTLLWRDSMIHLFAFGLVTLIAFKHGFTRHISHGPIATHTLLAMVVLYGSVYWRGGSVNPRYARAGYILAAIGALAGVILTAEVRVAGGALGPGLQQLAVLKTHAEAVIHPLTTLEQHRTKFAAVNRQIADAAGVSDLVGATDIFSYRQQVLIASGLEWRPRPVFQSYAAYTPTLLRLNAARYLAPRAPRNVLFTVETIDDRYPALEDSLLWPILLTRYDIVDVRSRYLLLRRSARPRDYVFRPLQRRSARLGAELPVPEAGSKPVWAVIEIRPTLVGRLASLVYKLPAVDLETTTLDGKRQVYRFITGIGRAGFLLSPIVDSTRDFGRLASDGRSELLRDHGVQSIRLRGSFGSDWLYKKTMNVRFFELSFPPQGLELVRLWRLDFPGASQQPLSAEGFAPFRAVLGPGNRTVALAHAQSRLVFGPGPSASRVEIGFGLVDGAWQFGWPPSVGLELRRSGAVVSACCASVQRGETDGVEFRVSVKDSSGSTVVWSRLVKPKENIQDRGVLTATIEIPKDLRGKPFVLETLPGPRGDLRWDWSFWSKIDLR